MSTRRSRPTRTRRAANALAIPGGALARTYGRFLRRVGRTAFFMRHVIPVTTRLDRWLYPRTGGRLTTTWPANIPTALLTTTGRHSGQPRVFPLFYQLDGRRVYLVTSIRGDWYRNLVANPDATIQLGRRTYRCRGKLLPEADREAIWPRFAAMWPAYDDYHRRTGHLYLFALDIGDPVGSSPAPGRQPAPPPA